MGAFADYKLNDHFTPYMEFMFACNTSRAQIAESGTFFAEAYILGLDDFPAPFLAALTELYPDNTGYDTSVSTSVSVTLRVALVLTTSQT